MLSNEFKYDFVDLTSLAKVQRKRRTGFPPPQLRNKGGNILIRHRGMVTPRQLQGPGNR
jgi:hypothetical protein